MNDYKELIADISDCLIANPSEQLAKRLLSEAKIAIIQLSIERNDLRNELCLKCGNYREAHNGACDGCRLE